ncbi:hypothetical protein CVT25_007258 [Psilocybe cyanescens]|uniref:Uncharacterized protein n=1 Tax=Psilocybe cyanescens TaxID=93625 RepID=A0A409WVI2_PSICY|nr:hypothetical protein CVT25_007258 [Psilocybe cyanescens]
MSSPTSPTTTTTPATAATSTIANALFFLVPLFSLALAVLALSHTPRQRAHTGPRPQARIAYAFITLLAILSTLVGALPFSNLGTPQAEAVVQALLSFLPYYGNGNGDDNAPQKANSGVLAILYSSVLVITLTGGQHDFFLFLHLDRVGAALFFRVLPAVPPSRSVSPLFIARPPPYRLSAKSTRRPITIHISTQRTSAPFSLPSPASSAASFPFSELEEQTQNQRQAIELEIALPKRKDSRSRLIDTDNRCLLYQDEKKSGALIDIESHRHRQKSSSIDSTTSTVTAVDHHPHSADNTTAVQRHHHRSLSPPLPLIPLATPPRAAYTSAATFEPDPSILFSSPAVSGSSQREAHTYRFPFNDVNVSASTESTDPGIPAVGIASTVKVQEDWSGNTSLRAQLTYSRTRSLLVFLLAAQLTLLVGYACALGADIPLRVRSSASASGVVSTASSAALRIIQAACTVLAVTGTMSAYLFIGTLVFGSRVGDVGRDAAFYGASWASIWCSPPLAPF